MNFKKFRILKSLPENSNFIYLMHSNLKQYLSGNNMFSILFSFIYTSSGSELFILCSLLHRNPYFLTLLFELGGIDLLKDIIVEKQLDGRMNEQDLFYLFNIACNESPSTRIFSPLTDDNSEEEDEEGDVKKPNIIPKF